MEFWCFEGHEARFDLVLGPVLTNSDLFSPIFTYFDLFRRADLTYFHLFRPTSFHNKAPWTGHLTSKNLSKNLIFTENRPLQVLSKNPSIARTINSLLISC